MNFDEMNAAVNQARSTISLADEFVGRMARLILGRLRRANVAPHVLNELKRELQSWDMHRKCWKED